MQNTEFSIATDALTCRYGDRTAVDALTLTVRPGEFFGFLGRNGAGKSTTMKMLTGILKPSEGAATVAGCDVVRDPLGVKARIGVVSEDTALYERLTAAEYLEFAGTMYGLSTREARTRAAGLLDLLELTPAQDRLIADYSMGMKKKTALAAALLHSPRVLFLDEPFNGVDPFSLRTLETILRGLTTERGVTVFFTSHVLETVERLCDRIAVLHEGRLRAVGTLPELRAQAGQGDDAPLETVYRHLVGAASAAPSTLSWRQP
jgi:ABC-2 type transport system ATP-binding protein